MKLYIVVILVVFAAVASAEKLNFSQDQIARVQKAITECVQQHAISEDAVKSWREGKFEGIDENVKCFTNCFLEKVDFFDKGAAKANVFAEKLTPLIGEDKVKELAGKCNGLQGANNCEKAQNVFQCYYTNGVQL